jgi:hypothetical protein
MSDEFTTHQIEGFCDGVMMKGDWSEYHINIGKTYPVKLSTKQPDVQAAAAGAGTQVAIWTYGEKQGGPNPHRPGEFFKNRYLNNVEVGGVLDPALAEPANATNSQSPVLSTEGRERSIERQTIIKACVALYPVVLESDEQWFDLISRLDRWITDKPAEAAKEPAPVVPPDDDDIPF